MMTLGTAVTQQEVCVAFSLLASGALQPLCRESISKMSLSAALITAATTGGLGVVRTPLCVQKGSTCWQM